ncbi:hypothetical protein HMPREF1546_03578 [Oscillibacter sp. KLE 1745]|jgi:hypothetical protein|nr:hypothetical protein HMPREF1546_03578 [Oscillibacter sp. KLE 1745]
MVSTPLPSPYQRAGKSATTGGFPGCQPRVADGKKKIISPESPEKTNKKSLLDNNFLLFYGKGRAAGGS